MADSKKPEQPEWMLTEEEIATSTKELFGQISNALKGYRDGIGCANIIINLSMNLLANGMVAFTKHSDLKGPAKIEAVRQLLQTWCAGYKQIMVTHDPEVAAKLELIVRDVVKLHKV